MYAPVLKKLVDQTETFIERCLPVPGNLFVKEGDPVRPFDRLGECVFSQKQMSFPKKLKPFKYRSGKQFYYGGSNLGRIGKAAVAAPFNGNLAKNSDGTYIFNAIDDKFILLSGVWGSVHKVTENKAVLLKTQTKNLLLSASTEVSVSGELVVFPNPVEILEKYYLESFSKGNEGKIVYVGHFADMEVVKRAGEMGAAAVLAGSAYRETFNYAKSKGLSFGLISGFGKLETPEPIYKLLSIIAYRYVFLDGGRRTLRIPHSTDDQAITVEAKTRVLDKKLGKKGTGKKGIKEKANNAPGSKKAESGSMVVKEVVKGIDVVCLQAPNFGKIGTVDSVSQSSIFVKFNSEKAGEKAAVEIKLPNFFIIE